jgi:hypothetical protein
VSDFLNRQTLFGAVALLEILILLFFAARWYGRRYGWRSSTRRLRRFFRATVADLARPLLQLYRFSRDVRLIGAFLADPAVPDSVRAVEDQVSDTLQEHPDTWTYAAYLSRTAVEVALAGPAPGPPGYAGLVDGRWVLPLPALTAPPPDSAAGPWSTDSAPTSAGGHVALGMDGDRLLLLDLDRAPGVLTLSGDERTTFSLLCAVAAQVGTGMLDTDGVEVIVTAGVHARFRGPAVVNALAALAERVGSKVPQPRLTVLVCGRIDDDQGGWMQDLCAALPALRIVTAGPYHGPRWDLPLTPDGRLVAPELGLHADTSGLERAVAQARRRRQDPGRAARPVVPAATVRPEPPASPALVPVPALRPGPRPEPDLTEPEPTTPGPSDGARAQESTSPGADTPGAAPQPAHH